MSTMTVLYVLAMAINLQLLCGSTFARVDGTLNATKNGSSVVIAVIAKIEASNIFSSSDPNWWSDYNVRNLVLIFLRRMAYVETDDGLERPSAGLGFWNISYETFNKTKTHLQCNSAPNNQIRHNMVNSSLVNVDWCDITYVNLSVPMYSGLAAALYVDYLIDTQNINLPTSNSSRMLSKLWLRFMHTDVDNRSREATWNKKVKELSRNERKMN